MRRRRGRIGTTSESKCTPPGIGYLLARAHERGLTNVRVLFGDAREALRHRFRDAMLDEIRLYFPDPWPKARHHKRRLVQPELAALAAARLRPGGRLLAATDDEDYALYMLSILGASPALRNLAGDGAFWSGPAERTPHPLRGARAAPRAPNPGPPVRAGAGGVKVEVDGSLLDAVRGIAAEAAERILDVYHSAFEVARKTDDSPLTEADLVSHRTIVEGLGRLTPRHPDPLRGVGGRRLRHPGRLDLLLARGPPGWYEGLRQAQR